MRLLLPLLSLLSLLLAPDIGHAAETLAFAPPPAWVVAAEPPAEATAATRGQAPASRLSDLQWRFDEAGSHAFARSILRISTAEALGLAGNVVVRWHPATQSVTVHGVTIHRGQERIDALAGDRRFTILRRESGLEQSAVDGYLTATLQIQDLRVGDSIEMAMTITEANPMFGGHSQAYLPLLAPFATDRLHVVASWPSSRPIRWRSGSALPRPTESRRDGFTILNLDQSAFTAPRFPEDAPAGLLDAFTLQASDFRSWREVSALFAEPFAAASRLGPESPLRAEIRRIAAASSDPLRRAQAALALVQGQVRYVFDGTGLGGYMPVAADQVWSSRFGDCKGKTVLLVALLREFGIEAVPALVSSGGGDLDQALPMPGRFDHALVMARIGGRTYWLDGTRSGDSDLARLTAAPFGWALPLTRTGSELERVERAQPAEPTIELTIEYDLRNGITLPAQLQAEVVMRGEGAAEVRRMLEALPPAERETAVRNYWSENFNNFEVAQVRHEVEPATGIVRYTASGTARLDWNLWGDNPTRRLHLQRARLGRDLAPERPSGPLSDAPVFVPPEYYVVRYRILLPLAGRDFLLEGEPIDRTVGPVHYRRTARLSGGRVDVEAATRIRGGEIGYAEAQAADRANDAIYGQRLLVRAPLTYEFTEAERRVVATDRSPDGAPSQMALIAAVMARLEARDLAGALREATAAVEGSGRSATLLALRATVHFAMGEEERGDADLDAALALEPNNARALLLRAHRLRESGRRDDALILLDRLILAHPQDPLAYEARAEARAGAGRLDAALADLEIATQLQPENREAWIAKVRIHNSRGNREAALSAAEALVRLFPEDATGHALHGNVLAILGRMEEARAALARSIQAEETADAYATRAEFNLSGGPQERLSDVLAAIRLDGLRGFSNHLLQALLEAPGAYDRIEAAYQAARREITPAQEQDHRRALARLYAAAGRPEAIIASLDEQIARNPGSAELLNERCWERAIRGLDLDRALADCNAAVAIARLPSYLDSRGLVHLRRGDFTAAIADYDAALALNPRLAHSLYGRGVAKLRSGDRAGGEADLTAARAIRASIAEEFRGYGLDR